MGKYTDKKNSLEKPFKCGKKVEMYVRILVALAVLVVVVVAQQKKRGSGQLGQNNFNSCVLSALVIIDYKLG